MTVIRRNRRLRALTCALLSTCAVVATGAPALADTTFQVGIQDSRTVNADPLVQGATLDSLQPLGVDVTRLTVSWNVIADGCGTADPASLASPDAACYDWSTIDRATALAHSRGIRLLVSLFGAPSWANGSTDAVFTGSSTSDFAAFSARFASFATAAASRYCSSPADEPITYWTIWNEPNGLAFWRPQTSDSPRRYAWLYTAAARAIKTTCPQALVAPGPTGPNSPPFKPVNWIHAVQPFLVKYGAGPYIDAWAHNPYPGGGVSPFTPVYTSPSAGIGNIQTLFDTLDASPVTSGKPVWATEFSYETNPPDTTFGVTPNNQAVWLAEALDLAWTTGRMPIFEWYVLQDSPSLSDWNSGLFTSSGQPKPAAAMFQRPVSVTTTGSGATRVWGASNIHPDSAGLVQSPDGATWTELASQPFDDGVRVAVATLPATTQVAVQDAAGRGPAIVVGDHERAGGGWLRGRLVVAQLDRHNRVRTCGMTRRTGCVHARASRLRVQVRSTVRRQQVVRLRVTRRDAHGRWHVVWSRRTRTNVRGVVIIRGPRLRTTGNVWRIRATGMGAQRCSASTWQYAVVH